MIRIPNVQEYPFASLRVNYAKIPIAIRINSGNADRFIKISLKKLFS